MKVLEEVNKFRSELEAALRIVQQMRGEFEAVGKQVAEAAEKLRDGLSSKKDIEVVRVAKEAQQLAKQAQQIAKSQKALQETELKILKQKQKLEEEIKFLKTEEAKRLEKLKQERQRLAKALKDEIRSQKSAYQDQLVRLNEIKAKLKDLLVLQRQLSKEGKTNTEEYARISQEIEKLQADFKEVDATVRAAEQSVGEYQRNVGNYANDIRSVLGDVISGFSDLGGEGVRAFISVGDAAKNAAVSFGRLLKSLIRVRKEGFGGLKASAIAFGGAIAGVVGTLLSKISSFFGDFSEDVGQFFTGFFDRLLRTGDVLEAFSSGKSFAKLNSNIRDLERSFGGLEVQIANLNKQAQEQANIAEDLSKPFRERIDAINKEVSLREQAIDREISYYGELEKNLRLAAELIKEQSRRAEIEDKADEAAKRRIELETQLLELAKERQQRLVDLALSSAEDISKAYLKQLQTLTDFSQNATNTNKAFWESYLETLKQARGKILDSIRALDENLKAAGIDTGKVFTEFATEVAKGEAEVNDFVKVFQKINELSPKFARQIADTFNELSEQLSNVNAQIRQISIRDKIMELETYRDLLQIIPDELPKFEEIKNFSEKINNLSIRFGLIFDPEKAASFFKTITDKGKKSLAEINTLSGVDKFVEENKANLKAQLGDRLRFLKNEYDVHKQIIQETIKDEDERRKELLKLDAEYYAKIRDEVGKYYDETLKLDREGIERRKKILMDALSDFQSFSNQIMSVFQENLRRQAQGIDKQIQSLQGIAQVQAELAARGIDNSLVEIERKLREAEAKRREREQRERRLAKVQAYFNALVEYMKADPATAPFKALVQIAIAEAIAGRFKEGVEDFRGKGGAKDDANLVLISTGESVITAEATKRYKGLPTAMNEGRVEKWVQERYNSTVDFTKLGEWIVSTIQDGVKKREILRKRPF